MAAWSERVEGLPATDENGGLAFADDDLRPHAPVATAALWFTPGEFLVANVGMINNVDNACHKVAPCDRLVLRIFGVEVGQDVFTEAKGFHGFLCEVVNGLDGGLDGFVFFDGGFEIV